MVQPDIMTTPVKTNAQQKPGRRIPKICDSGKIVRIPVNRLGIILAALIGISLFIGAAYAETSSETLTALGRNVYVSGVTYDPAVFFTDDIGTVTFHVTNGNSNQSISVNHASFGDQDIKRTSGTYDSSSAIGPLQTRDYTFSVLANGQDGTYYPPFSLSYYGTGGLWIKDPVQVDNTPLLLLITSQPDTFAQSGKETISVQVSNPRKNEVKNVILSVSGDYMEIMPLKTFIGRLASGESTTMNFSVTPNQPATLILKVDYNNGDNIHTVTTSLPITFTEDKKQANLVVSNIVVTNNDGIYHVKGDVTNAGLQTANGATVTSLAPAQPQDPYRSYVIGALKTDDFGSFEITFSTDGETSIPLGLSYKDKDGNVITSEQQVSLAEATVTDANAGQPGLLPVIGIVIIIALACGGYLFMKKRKNQ
jgi:hypothetical protein